MWIILKSNFELELATSNFIIKSCWGSQLQVGISFLANSKHMYTVMTVYKLEIMMVFFVVAAPLHHVDVDHLLLLALLLLRLPLRRRLPMRSMQLMRIMKLMKLMRLKPLRCRELRNA